MNWIYKQLMGLVSGPMVGRLVRHGLTVLAGMLAASAWPGLKEIADLLIANLDSISQNLTVAILALLALLMSVRADKK